MMSEELNKKINYKRIKTMHSIKEPLISSHGKAELSFAVTKDSSKLLFGQRDGWIKMMDIRTSFMVEKAVYAFNGTVQRIEVSECGDYLATVGFTINGE